jgi:hypothetical protein
MNLNALLALLSVSYRDYHVDLVKGRFLSAHNIGKQLFAQGLFDKLDES